MAIIMRRIHRNTLFIDYTSGYFRAHPLSVNTLFKRHRLTNSNAADICRILGVPFRALQAWSHAVELVGAWVGGLPGEKTPGSIALDGKTLAGQRRQGQEDFTEDRARAVRASRIRRHRMPWPGRPPPRIVTPR